MAYDLTLNEMQTDPACHYSITINATKAELYISTPAAPVEDVGNEITCFGLTFVVLKAEKMGDRWITYGETK